VAERSVKSQKTKVFKLNLLSKKPIIIDKTENN